MKNLPPETAAPASLHPTKKPGLFTLLFRKLFRKKKKTESSIYPLR